MAVDERWCGVDGAVQVTSQAHDYVSDDLH